MREIHTIFDLRDMMHDMNAERMATEVLPQNVEAHMDIVYDPTAAVPYGSLDVFRPLDQPGKLPVIIDVHGGGFCQGEKDINENYCRHLALEGFVTVNVAYTLVPEVHVDDQLRQCMLAYRWVREHIEEFGGDLNNVYATGDSAGGYLTFYLAALTGSAKLRELIGCVDPELTVRAIGLTCPKVYNEGGFGADILDDYMFRAEDRQKEFLQYIGCPKATYSLHCMPPVWFMTTELDIIREPNIELDRDLAALGAEYEFQYLPQTEGLEHELRHVFNVTHPNWKESQEINASMLNFFRRYAI